MMKTETQRDYEERILRVLVHIQKHLDDALDLEELAALANFSPYHFHRVFRGMVGEPIMEFVRRLRLERAAIHLKFTDCNITHIAFDAGYETHEAFTRSFRAHFGQSPTEFRQSRQAALAKRVPSGIHYKPDGVVGEFEASTSEVNTMDVRVEELKPMRVAFMRHMGPYDQVAGLWQKFVAWALPRGLFGRGKVLSICHDDPEITPPDKVRYDACIEVGADFRPEGEVGVQDIPGGKYAIALHKGPYAGLAGAYGTLLGQWMPANNRQPAKSPFFEVYLNNPQMTKPEDLLTEIYVPLAC